jgi:cytochrome b subunit of formate dehydrogenase
MIKLLVLFVVLVTLCVVQFVSGTALVGSSFWTLVFPAIVVAQLIGFKLLVPKAAEDE